MFALAKNHLEINPPLLGYNKDMSKENGYYLFYTLRVIDLANNLNLPLNMSSGVCDFKRRRGGVPDFRYDLFYTKHLGLGPRIIYKIMEYLSHTILRSYYVKNKI